MSQANILFLGETGNIPYEIVSSGQLVNWKEIESRSGKRKSPVDQTGKMVGYNGATAKKSFNEAVELGKITGFGIGVSLGEGLSTISQGACGYLWCLDFDGFCDLETGVLDAELKEILSYIGGYLEYSPSGTGAKLFFVSDKPPVKKLNILFTTSHLAAKHPHIKKYRERQIEVFSKNSFLTLTGKKPFENEFSEICFIDSKRLERLLDRINDIAKRDGGLGIEKFEKEFTHTPDTQSAKYNKLTTGSLKRVLENIDPDAESCWTDTANALARVYGEDGRSHFHSYSKRSDKYNHDEVERRFDRALDELKKKPDGVGMKRLLQLASIEPNTLAWEDEEENIPLFKQRVNDVAAIFEDVELRQEDVDAMADAEILYPDMIVRGHVQAYVSPANGGKTTIMVYICEKLAEDGLEVMYVNVDASPGDLKRHFAHAKTHGYKLIAPDARAGGSPKLVLEKMYALADSELSLSKYVFIFDTLKKFVQIIDKSKVAELFKLMRSLSVKGATIILLGHTNKHRGEDGNTIFEGTGDLRNDVDELIYLDCFKNDTDGTLEVTTRPDKVRAELQPRTFIIDLKNDRKVSESAHVKKVIAKEERKILDLFKDAINAGGESQGQLVDYVEPKCGLGRPKLRKLLIGFTQWDMPEIVSEKTGRGKDLKYKLAGGGSY